MLGYFDVFPEKCKTELRTAYFPNGDDTFPAGTYVFTEYYCSDVSCDCQRLLVKVFHVSELKLVPEEVATISYTWHQAPDDSWKSIVSDVANPFLDPFHRQSACATELMSFWHDMVCRDRDYADRLKRHYVELRRVHGKSEQLLLQEDSSGAIACTVVAERRRARNLRLRQLQKKRGRRSKA